MGRPSTKYRTYTDLPAELGSCHIMEIEREAIRVVRQLRSPTGQHRNETEVERCYVVLAVGLGTQTWLAKIACPREVAKLLESLPLPTAKVTNRGAAQRGLAGRQSER
jgi:hypothetical protein